MEMTRKIIAIIITVMVGVRMLQTPNQTWFDVISDWTWSLCGLVLLLLLMYEVPKQWHPARRIYSRSIQKRKDEAVGAIDKMRRLPSSTFFTSIDYDPHNRVITAAVGFKRTWRRRAVDAVLWLANRRILPPWLTIAVVEQLGWKYRSQST